MLLKPLPYPSPDRLVVLRIFVPAFAAQVRPCPSTPRTSPPGRRIAARAKKLAAVDATATTLTGASGAEQLDAARVTANFFDFFGIAPAVGRGFLPEEAGLVRTPSL